jgi:transposase
VVERQGIPLAVKVTAANRQDCTVFAALTSESGVSRAASRVEGSNRASGSRRHRWVVERTLAWLNRFRRLTIRHERYVDIHEAFLHLGCILICWNFIKKRFC